MPKLFELVSVTSMFVGTIISVFAIKNQIDASHNKPSAHGNERSDIANQYKTHGLSIKSDNVHPNKKLNYDRYFACFKLLGPGK